MTTKVRCYSCKKRISRRGNFCYGCRHHICRACAVNGHHYGHKDGDHIMIGKQGKR